MDKKEKWVHETLKSLDNIKTASPRDDLFDTIITRIPVNKERKIIPLRHLGWVAAVAVIILTVNIYTLKLKKDSIDNTAKKSEDQISLLTDYSF
ncbi:hypothetical protein [Aquimarina sp. Aq107]|uniref:hypothetical protein n=1 Tax=Aquimarina sp. Aq107 TaxID=1191912 RepID=UPI000D55FE02|nr:hypothetical protein [Aquimarina sp. Aq107]